MLRKGLAVVFLVLLATSMLIIERDDELAAHKHKLQAWADYYNKWHNLPAFSKEGKWLVESNFDHKTHWKWQLEMIEEQKILDLQSVAHESLER